MAKGPEVDALVVGLGNPGAEYDGTRHNVGFDTVDLLARRRGTNWRSAKQRALVCEVTLGERRLALAKPQTYMNLSGESVQALLKFHGLGPDALCVIHDELDLPLATVRIKFGGGTAGHQGLNSIVKCTKTKDFARVRIGIDRPPGRMPVADYVLRRFGTKDADEVAIAVETAADVVESWLVHGVEATQNAFHTR